MTNEKIIRTAIKNGTACVLSMVEDGEIGADTLIKVIDQFCTSYGTEYTATLLMEMPCYPKIKAYLDTPSFMLGYKTGYEQGYTEGYNDGEEWANENPPIRYNY